MKQAKWSNRLSQLEHVSSQLYYVFVLGSAELPISSPYIKSNAYNTNVAVVVSLSDLLYGGASSRPVEG